MPILLSEQDVRIVLSMDDLIGAMETALSGVFRRPRRAAAAHGHRGRPAEGVLRRDARLHSRSARAWRQAGHGVREQPGGRPADAPCDDRAARFDDGRAPRGDGRTLHHGGPHGGRVGGLGEAPGARRRGRGGDDRLRRAGAQPPRCDCPRAIASQRARLEPRPGPSQRLQAGDAATHESADHALHVSARSGRRRRHRRARHVVARAGRPQRVDRRRRAHLRHRRVPARSARNGLSAGVARTPVRRLESRGACGSGRPAASR